MFSVCPPGRGNPVRSWQGWGQKGISLSQVLTGGIEVGGTPVRSWLWGKGEGVPQSGPGTWVPPIPPPPPPDSTHRQDTPRAVRLLRSRRRTFLFWQQGSALKILVSSCERFERNSLSSNQPFSHHSQLHSTIVNIYLSDSSSRKTRYHFSNMKRLRLFMLV